MKILITDYEEELNNRNLSYEMELLKRELGAETEVVIYPFESVEGLICQGKDADGILTAFVEMTRETLLELKQLKAISINATGYNFVHLPTTIEKNITLCAIGEYCTNEVADQTIAMMLSLFRNIKHYDHEVSNHNKWNYADIKPPKRLENSTLGIVGFGKIGKAVATRAKAFGMRILANDPLLTEEEARKYGVKKAKVKEIFAESDVITNHMDANESNVKYFNLEKFRCMEKQPIFLNLARGVSMDENDVEKALEAGYIRGAGLDVLESESPDLINCRLTNRSNVIITPHSAFYSKEAFKELQKFSCYNLIYCLRGELDKAFKIVNTVE